MSLLDRINALVDPGPGPAPSTPDEWKTAPTLDVEVSTGGAQIIAVDGTKVVFDATVSESHEESLDLSGHPVERGATISDHAIVQPAEVQLINLVTLTPLNDEYAEPRRHFNLYERLRELYLRREIVTLVTRLRTYDSMMVTGVSTPITVDDGEMLVPSVRLSEVRFAESQVAKVPREYLAPEVADEAASTTSQDREPPDDPTEREGSLLVNWLIERDIVEPLP